MNQRWGRKRDFREIAFLTLVSYMAVGLTKESLCVKCKILWASVQDCELSNAKWRSSSVLRIPSPDHRSSFPAWPDDGGPNQRKGFVIRIVEMQRFWSRTAKQSADHRAICRQQNHPVALLSVMRCSKIFWIWLLMYKIFLISNILHLTVHRLVDAPSPHLHLKLPPLTHPSGR
jgi:hypothetical protein